MLFGGGTRILLFLTVGSRSIFSIEGRIRIRSRSTPPGVESGPGQLHPDSNPVQVNSTRIRIRSGSTPPGSESGPGQLHPDSNPVRVNFTRIRIWSGTTLPGSESGPGQLHPDPKTWCTGKGLKVSCNKQPFFAATQH